MYQLTHNKQYKLFRQKKESIYGQSRYVPLCLVLSSYMYGLATPTKIPPPIHIENIME